MTSLDYYLTKDHAARQRTILISVAAGALAGMSLQLLNGSFALAVIACVAITVGIQFLRALTYKTAIVAKRKPTNRATLPAPQVRRYLIQAAVSAAGFFVLVALRVSRIEAAVMDRKLREAIAGKPPYPKAYHLVRAAIQNDIPADPPSIDSAKRRAISGALEARLTPDELNKSVAPTLVQLEVYKLYALTGIKLNTAPVSVFFPSGTYRVGGSVKGDGVSLAGENRSTTIELVDFDNTPESPALFVYTNEMRSDVVLGNMTALRRSDNISTAPAFVAAESGAFRVAVTDVTLSNLSQDLDTVIWVNTSFNRCRVTYRGGALEMNSVTFTDCVFSSAAGKGQLVLDKIRANGEKPMTLKVH
jgi:hypothetical protein